MGLHLLRDVMSCVQLLSIRGGDSMTAIEYQSFLVGAVGWLHFCAVEAEQK